MGRHFNLLIITHISDKGNIGEQTFTILWLVGKTSWPKCQPRNLLKYNTLHITRDVMYLQELYADYLENKNYFAKKEPEKMSLVHCLHIWMQQHSTHSSDTNQAHQRGSLVKKIIWMPSPFIHIRDSSKQQSHDCSECPVQNEVTQCCQCICKECGKLS